ncbi:polynucleotide adenylyltransferase PcnB [Nitrosospira sp. Is2]|uniref:polynucleotide adenylyltransferase PcnB n=1 Tax=Nitrosospira sp. Is2 TaxID=3080532 RepID=UPI0029544EC2|nr:polynucleotide adenylyltransferase PcnB [Nitrosospira sp. Is2]WON73131.1 polynucleotide adenylyltransferase PcnB [Nitrosospira sp. Is2]
MIRQLLHRVFGRNTSAPSATRASSSSPRIIPREQHGIARDHIHPCALKVTSGLQEAGYAAFIVGGAARDLLLGLEPKDFDVATNATPEEVRAIFRRSRIIGRRFRLVHVMCGAETVEVSTFRGGPSGPPSPPSLPSLPGPSGNGENGETLHAHADEHGRLLRDNVFGSQEEDAKRRDFTVNALFFDPVQEELWDYLNGYEDLKAGRLKIIGDPVRRYREDPIRMLRVVRLAAKLDMQIDPNTAAPIGDLAPLLRNVPPSRLFEEMLKLLLSGHALSCVVDLRTRGLHHGLLPMLDVILEQPLGERFITLALKNTDERVRKEKPVSPGFLFAALLWHEVLAAWNARQSTGEKPVHALHQAMSDVLAVQNENLAIPRRYDAIMKEIWAMQSRFTGRSGRRPFRLLEHPRFRAAYDFMLLRCESGEIEMELGKWWEEFQHAPAGEREAMLLKDDAPRKRRRTRGRKKSAPANTAAADNTIVETSE